MRTLVLSIELILFAYFVASNLFYIWTASVSLWRLPAYMKRRRLEPLRAEFSEYELPISVVVPVYNEEEGVVNTVASLLAQRYAEYELVVVNDGSSDETLNLLVKTFGLVKSVEPYRTQIHTTSVRATYESSIHPKLRVIDKVNGGKADALNTGINVSRYPLVFCTDGDSYYSPHALSALVEPFVNDERTVLVGASIGVSNDCDIANGTMRAVKLPRNWLARFQILEYMRSFLSSRLGWAPLNALGIVSGACGLYRKDLLVNLGGFRTDTIWEDMEMTVRVHHYLRTLGRPYRVAFTPHVVCWTQVPGTWKALVAQRVGWHRHVSEVMRIHRALLFNRRGGLMGWLSLPYLFFFEWFAPMAVILGVAFGGIAFYLGFLDGRSQIILLSLVFALSLVVSMLGLLLDKISFDTYSTRDTILLFVAAFLENLGFRQIVTIANLLGTIKWSIELADNAGRTFIGPRVREYRPLRAPDWRKSL